MRRQKHLEGRYPKRRDDVIWKQVASAGILLDLRSGVYFESDAVGLAIWEQCDGRKPLEAIGQALVQKFGAPPRRVLSDTAGFVSALAKQGLVDLLQHPAG